MALTDVNLFRIDGDLGSVSNIQTSALNGGPLAGTRNRIINGDMRIDQRNAGASVSFAASASGFPVDRFEFSNVTDGAWTGQRSTTAPTGFTNSLLLTVTTADASVGATQFAITAQKVEGFNAADLGWGTASARTVTLSFWIRSSLTGTFGGAFVNSAQDRSYPFTYTINSANTFEYKTITVTGDTSGTWLSDNGIGLRVYFGLGVGATYSGTAGSWSGSLLFSATGATSVVGTNGATFYITGVQLEAGTVATPFERRSYGQELSLCQRYYEKSYPTDVAVGANTGNANGSIMNVAINTADFYSYGTFRFQMTKRDIPTVIFYNPVTGQAGGFRGVSDATNNAVTTVATFIGHTGVGRVGAASNNMSGGFVYAFHYSASAEL